MMDDVAGELCSQSAEAAQRHLCINKPLLTWRTALFFTENEGVL